MTVHTTDPFPATPWFGSLDPDDHDLMEQLADCEGICNIWHRDYEAGDRPCKTCVRFVRLVVERVLDHARREHLRAQMEAQP